MFNNERINKMSEKKKVFLIIKKTYWEHDGDTWFDVAEHADTKERAEKCLEALNTLKSDEKVSYLICEVNHENK